MRYSLLSRPSLTATATSRPPMAMEAVPSQTGDPVTCQRARPSAARTRPITAAESSNSVALTVVSGLARM